MHASISFVPLSRRAAVLMLVLFMAAVAYAQITPSDDAYVNSALPTNNYGFAVTLNLNSSVATSFIRFDLTAVPTGYTGASIAKATLKLYVNGVATAGSFNVDYVTGTWAEQTIKYSLQPAIGTAIVSSVPLTTASKGKYVEIDITPAVVEWLNGTQPNDGIALVANSPLVATFDSKENTAASHAPELDIVYAGGGTITGVTTASGSGLIGGGTSGTLNLSLLTSCGSGQVLKWSGSAWACASLSGGGTITGVTAGTDLKGGGTSGVVTLNLDTTKVPQLGSTNTFTANQTINGNVYINSTSGSSLVASGGYTGLYGTGANTGVSGTSPGSPGYGVHGQASGSNGTGVFGESLAASGYGVYGSGPTGVYGISSSSVGVQGNGGTYGVFGSGTGTSSTGVYGTGRTYGVYGTISTNTNSGVLGVDTSSGGGYGVSGTSTNGTGVYGTGYLYGVYGTPPSGGEGGTGVYGVSNGGVGVRGSGGTYGDGMQADGENGVVGLGSMYGVYGIANATGAYGVYGLQEAGTYAGYFEGNVSVTGALTSGVKDFRIDHPLDPANKYLYHASVESSEMMNIYTGNAILDKDGTAWVTLPDYFGALNRDFRYQLTAVGAPGPNLYIAQKITNNRFQIAGGTPDGEVSWQVTGIRQDDYAKAHPIIPEVEKTGEERGKYLHPVEHGLPKSMGIDESRRAKMLALHPEPPKLPEQAALPEPPRLAPPKLPQQPPVPAAPPRPKSPVQQQHVAVPEAPK